MTDFTPKQRELMRLWQRDELARINLLEGSVSSGKTWVSLVLWAFWVSTMPQDKLYLMCAKSLTTLKRNCLILLQELVGARNFTFSVPAKEGYLFGRRVLFEGANDARSESKIRGMTLQGAYCDELTQFPQDFFAMLLSRLRVPGAKLIATTNPDSPNHWLMTDYIERKDELDFLDVKFTIEDNTTLDPEYVRAIKNEYVGVFYERFILGNWVIAEGLVYGDAYSEDRNLTDEIPTEGDWYISIDYGTMNPFAAGLWRVTDEQAVMVKEYYYSGRSERAQKTDEEYYTELERLAGDREIERVIIDPSAASMVATIHQHGRFSVTKAKNDVIPGILTTARYLQQGKILINRSCEGIIKEFGLYSWDPDSTEDAVIKENDHCLTGDTMVDTLAGPYRIDELVGKCGFVYCTDGERVKTSVFDGVRMTREEADVYELTLIDGRSVKATADHQILTRRGWVQLKDLRTDDEIACIGGNENESNLQ